MSGQLVIVLVPSASSAAAISFRTEFFAPEMRTEPDSGPDRRTRMTERPLVSVCESSEAAPTPSVWWAAGRTGGQPITTSTPDGASGSMTTVEVVHEVDDRGLSELRAPRDDLVRELAPEPTDRIGHLGVKLKHNANKATLAGKSVVLVDDSIVRGTTSKKRVNSLKEAGAKEVHVMVSCPPHKNPCVYGIDFPDRNKLMAANHTLDEICTYLNADSVNYLSQAGMVRATGKPEAAFCLACYDGVYPVEYDPHVDKHIMERRRARTESLVADDSQPKLL